MTSRRARRVTFGTALTVLGSALTLRIPLARLGWAQAPADPIGPGDLARSEDVVAFILIVVAGPLLVLGVVGNMLDLAQG